MFKKQLKEVPEHKIGWQKWAMYEYISPFKKT